MFIVIELRHMHFVALLVYANAPCRSDLLKSVSGIFSYKDSGVSKPHLLKSDHCIVYTGRQPPEPFKAELEQNPILGLRDRLIRISPEDRSTKLHDSSRIKLAREYTPIDYERVFVRHIGDVKVDSLNRLLEHWLQVRREKETAAALQARAIINAATRMNAGA